MPGDDWTLGEIRRSLLRLEEGVKDLNKKVDEQARDYVRHDTYDEAISALSGRLDRGAGWVKGIVVAVIGVAASSGGVFILRGHP